jgi:hypothetical protein
VIERKLSVAERWWTVVKTSILLANAITNQGQISYLKAYHRLGNALEGDVALDRSGWRDGLGRYAASS